MSSQGVRSLVVVLVAQPLILRVEDVTDGDVGADAEGRQGSLEGKLGAGGAGLGAARDVGVALGLLELPRLPVAVNECVVHEEGGVAGGAGDGGHDGAEAVVAVTVGTELDALPHVGVGGTRVAGVDVDLVHVRGDGRVLTAGKAVLGVLLVGSNVQDASSESLSSGSVMPQI